MSRAHAGHVWVARRAPVARYSEADADRFLKRRAAPFNPAHGTLTGMYAAPTSSAVPGPLEIFPTGIVAYHKSTDVILNGTDVSQWTDLSGAGNHWIQATASLQPAYNTTGGPEGGPVVSATISGTEYMRFAYVFSPPGTTPITIWCLARVANNPGSQNALLYGNSYRLGFTLQPTSGTGYKMNAGVAVNQTDSESFTWRRWQGEFQNSTADRLRVGPNTISGANSGNTVNSSHQQLNGNATTLNVDCEYVETLYLNLIPDTTQREALEAYADAEYPSAGWHV